MRLYKPPFPLRIDVEKKTQSPGCKNTPKSDAVLQELKNAQGSENLKIVSGAPIGFIREVKENGGNIFLVNIDIARCFDPELIDTKTADWEHMEEKGEANKKLEVGDPNIIWSFGDFLAPSYHGQGIMTDAVETLLHDWAIPRMNVHKILAGVFVGNEASLRVFQKNGFVLSRRIEEYKEVRGKMKGLYVVEWKSDNNDA